MKLFQPQDIIDLRKALDITQEELGERLGLSETSVNKMENGKAVISKFTQVKLNALKEEATSTVNEPSAPYGRTLIPFYDIDAAAGRNELDMMPVTRNSSMIDVGDLLRDSECAIRIYGNSMVPNYPSGCVVGLREVRDDIVEYGNVYVIETSDNRYLKRIFKDKTGKGYTCYSDNTQVFTEGPRTGEPFYEPFIIPFASKKRLYRVIGVIKRNENSSIFGK